MERLRDDATTLDTFNGERDAKGRFVLACGEYDSPLTTRFRFIGEATIRLFVIGELRDMGDNNEREPMPSSYVGTTNGVSCAGTFGGLESVVKLYE